VSSEGLWRRAQRGLEEAIAGVLKQHATPARLGWAVAWGVFVGCSPLLGLQTVIALGLAFPLKLNRAAVLLGTQISFPPMTAVILFADAQLGECVLRGQWLPITVEGMKQLGWRNLGVRLFVDMCVGGVLIGGAAGSVLGGLTYRAALRRQR